MKTTNRFESFQTMQDRCHAAEIALGNLHAEMQLTISHLAPVVVNSPMFNDRICQDAIKDLLSDTVVNWLVSSPTIRVPFQCTDSADTTFDVNFVL
jgi:hypothetical protein